MLLDRIRKLFASVAFDDQTLGSFVRSRGMWRGTVVLADTSLPLAVAGTRHVPDENALAIARRLPATWSAQREAVMRALLEHLEPYLEADPGSAPPADIWRSVALQSAAVLPLERKLIAEIALSVDWDEEHTLGARFDEDGALVELNGSILPA